MITMMSFDKLLERITIVLKFLFRVIKRHNTTVLCGNKHANGLTVTSSS